MKQIQVFDGAENSVYDVFAATEEEFALIFPEGEDVAFIDEVMARGPEMELDAAFARIWVRRIRKRDVNGIHGVLFTSSSAKSSTTRPERTRKQSTRMARRFDSMRSNSSLESRRSASATQLRR